ncbi:NAD(P)-dependent alcohol dehydrogenase [Occallatibacter riparius]|uniref:NAD(P)-dependent alcohol dehydrogenase n=1 Tax=Occallatibacter riparius TaxID=1002689 RepID=A0A9J7BRZ3_9BACT|nr:NAD(P)-dependent alcohol dehydrogenase [Occallatibacter riparius]UWZ85660.1 NAD(P)-dependent alcohol dehydrogenase [Occallatibacter riparius]
MKAIVYEQYGPPDVLSLKEIDKPLPGKGEVLVRVHAASVNPYDWHFLRGKPALLQLFTGIGKPRYPRLGADCAGVVEAVGSGTTRFKPGDAVFGVCKGSFAEFACGKETQLALRPAGVSFEQAASLPIAATTALQGLRDRAKIKAGQQLLINGAAGGVGTFAVQIEREMGAHVTAVCSGRNADLMRSLGAECVIDYMQEDFTRSPQKWDAIFDLVGNRTLAEFRSALQPKGVFVSCGGGGPDKKATELAGVMFGKMLIAPFVSQRLTGVLAKINGADLSTLAAMVESGKIKPVLDRTYPLAETAEAVRYVEACHARGKVIIALG